MNLVIEDMPLMAMAHQDILNIISYVKMLDIFPDHRGTSDGFADVRILSESQINVHQYLPYSYLSKKGNSLLARAEWKRKQMGHSM